MIASSWSIVVPGEVSRRGAALAVATAGPVLDDAAQVLHLGQPVRARERRQRRGDERQVERRRPADLGGQLDDAGVAGEAAALLGARAQVGAGRRRQPRVELVEAAAGPHGGQRGGQAALGRRGVVGVGRGDAADVVAGGQLGEGVVAGRVERVAVVPQLDEHPVAPERRRPARRSSRRAAAGPSATSAAGTAPLRQPVSTQTCPAVLRATSAKRELRRPLLPRQVAEAERAGQPGVARRAVGEQQEVVAVGIGGMAVGHPAGGHLGQRLGLLAWRPGRWRSRPGVSVISAPNTVGIPTARAASAKRTTP